MLTAGQRPAESHDHDDDEREHGGRHACFARPASECKIQRGNGREPWLETR